MAALVTKKVISDQAEASPFFWLDFDPLMVYDLQWSQPEDLSLVSKKWYEDEDLVVTWNRIKAKPFIS